MLRPVQRPWLALCCFVFISPILFAQSDKLQGTVADTSGARVAAANLTLSCPQAASRQAHTDSDGHYEFSHAAQDCTLQVSASGFATATQPVSALHGGDITLAVQQVSNTVTVSGNTGYVAVEASTATKTDTPIGEVPQAISVVTRDQMDIQGAESVPEALRYSAGMVPEERGINGDAYETLSGRGFLMEEYLDGLRLPNVGAGFLIPSFDPFDLQSIEILHGPASVLFGQAYPAGLVNFQSKAPLSTTLRQIDFTPGNYHRYQGDWDFSGPLFGNEHYLYRLAGLARRNDEQVNFAQQERYMIAPSFTWRPDEKTSLTALFNYQYDPKVGFYNLLPAIGTVQPDPLGQVPTSFNPGDPGFDRHSRRTYSAEYLFSRNINHIWSVQQNFRYFHISDNFTNIYTEDLRDDNRTLDRYSFVNNEHIDAATVDTHATAQLTRGPVKQTIIAGVDFQNMPYEEAYGFDFDSDFPTQDMYAPKYYLPVAIPSYAGDDHVQFHETGVYGQDQLRYRKLAVTVGGREDWAYSNDHETIANTVQEQSDHAFTGRVGAVYLAGNGFSPYYSYSTSFQPQIGVAFDGSTFKPTTGEQHELGVKYQPPHFNGFFTVSAFNLTEHNVTTPDQDHANFSVETGAVRSRGIEVESHANLTNGIGIIAGYSFLDNVVTAANADPSEYDLQLGKALSATPENIFQFWTDYSPSFHKLAGLKIGSGVRYIGSSYGDDLNSFTVPACALVDAAAHYTLPFVGNERFHWQVSINATNISDRRYVSSCIDATAGCFYGARRNLIGNVGIKW